MANLPQKHPHLGIHLTDRALTPLITSARTQQQQQQQREALTALSRAALSAHEAASRLGLGSPQRVAVEHRDAGPVVLQSFMSASSASASPAPSSSSPASSRRAGHGRGGGGGGGGANGGGIVSGGYGGPRDQDDRNDPGREDGGDTATAADAKDENEDNDDNRDEERRTHDTLHNTTARLRQVQLGHDDYDNDDHNDREYEGRSEDGDGADVPPMLVGVVVAPSADEALGARRAAARLERVGREVQARWAEAAN